MWDAQMAPFADRFRVIRYDSRGHGQSDAPVGLYTMDRLGRDALAILDALNIERTFYCGLSKGGMVGQWLGSHAPARVERMALCNTSAHIPLPDLWNMRIEVATTKGMSALLQGIVERWFSEEFRKEHRAEVARISEMVLATPGHGYAGCCAAIRDMDQRETTKTITVPTLVVAGSKDPATPPDHGRLIHELIKGSEFVLLDAAHLSNIEQTEEFNRAVLGFFAH
jgi:3-oxoadipate enol-lactonase